MAEKTVGILYGGKSGEHEVSLRSAASVYRNLNKEKYRIILIGIDPEGIWYLQDAGAVSSESEYLSLFRNPEDTVSIVPGKGLYARHKNLSLDVVFPVLHGTFGEDGTVQGLLETADIPYVGAGVLSSAVSMDKEKTKLLWANEGLPVVPYLMVRKWQVTAPDFSWDELAGRLKEKFGFPVFVKPASAGSSVGVKKVSGPEGLEEAVHYALSFDTKVLLERSVNAREIECSVIGNHGGEKACIPGEIIPSHEFYDYDAKYLDPSGAVLSIPADLPQETLEKIRSLAVRAYQAVDCEGMARVDFFLEKGTEEIYLNEINTIPGFTSISMFARMCGASDLPYSSLLDLLLELAAGKHEIRDQLRYSR